MTTPDAKTMTLYRPVGLREMELILKVDPRLPTVEITKAGQPIDIIPETKQAVAKSRSGGFPPRLPEQPIFYPVLNFEYAEQIARDWNTKNPESGYCGFVTEFEVDKAYSGKFEVQTVGASIHKELWVPAEELEEFNNHIKGYINLKAAYYGEQYRGIKNWHMEWYADEMFDGFYQLSSDYGQDFLGELLSNAIAVFLNFKYWIEHDYSDIVPQDEKERLLRLIADTWSRTFPHMPLFGHDLIRDTST